MRGVTKKKVEGSEVGIAARVKPTADHIEPILECFNPAAGEEQVIAYIAGDLIGRKCEDFIAHVAECRYCLKEVVLWCVAEVLAIEDMEREKGVRRHASTRESHHSSAREFSFRQQSRRGLFTQRATSDPFLGTRKKVSLGVVPEFPHRKHKDIERSCRSLTSETSVDASLVCSREC